MPHLSKRISSIPPSATVRIADLATSLRNQGEQVLDFSAGRAVEHTPQYVSQSAIDAINRGDTHQTMAQGKPRYRAACAKKLARENGITANPETEIIATLGCKQGLTLALMAVLNPGDEIIVEDPAFVSYEPTIQFCGAKAIPVPLLAADSFRWRAEALAKAITPRTRAILYCSPHNPTGTVHTREDLEVIANIAKKHNLWVIADETYERVTWGTARHLCMRTLTGMKERTIGVMGLTKSFSMGGWRIGFAYASPEVVGAMKVLQQHLMTCAGSFTQTGAQKALDEPPPQTVLDLWSDWEARCRYLTNAINEIDGIQCAMPEGGFYAWIDISETGWMSEPCVVHLLEEYKIALVPGAAFGPTGEGFLRMTCVKSWEHIREGAARLKAWASTITPSHA